MEKTIRCPMCGELVRFKGKKGDWVKCTQCKTEFRPLVATNVTAEPA
jgi:tRNA(Ile2) C34 agmatinyltransferase TiaS